jgi:glycosyltransferase involved in cell wall biosynthesis
VVAPGRARGGCEEYLLRVARGVRDRGWEVTAAHPLLPATRSVHAELRELGATPVPWLDEDGEELERWGTLADQGRALDRLLRRWQPDAVLLALPSPLSALGVIRQLDATRLPITVVFQLCARELPVTPSDCAACERARQTGQTWVAVSDDNRRHLSASFRIPADRIRVVANGVDAAEAVDGSSRRRARAALGVPSDAEVVLTVGRVTPQKGYEAWIDAVAALAPARPRLRAWWAGDGEDVGRMARLIRQRGLDHVVRALGARSDVETLLAAASVFVLPSAFEGLPFALLEAMAAGVPVVASDIAPHRAVVTPLVHGRLVSPGGLAAAIGAALDDPAGARALAAAGREHVRRTFTAERMVHAVCESLGIGGVGIGEVGPRVETRPARERKLGR